MQTRNDYQYEQMKDFDKKYQLSIIVPVYNVERYIRPCMESIFCQGLDDKDYEVIIVNDGTQDRSMEIIQDIISQHDNVTVINQENQSLSVARNNGIAIAKGEYILMPDSDDMLVKNSLGILLEKALESKADLVVADFLELTDEEIERFDNFAQKYLKVKEKSGKEMFLEDLNPHKCFVWNKLYRRDFICDNHLMFVPGIRYQDVPFTHECYLKADKCLKVSWLLNIYRKGRTSAATASFNKNKAHDFCIAIAKTWNLTKYVKDREILTKLQNDVFVSFSFLICLVAYCFNDNATRMDIIRFLKKQAPDLSFRNGWYQKISSFLYIHTPLLFMNIHYYGRKLNNNI